MPIEYEIANIYTLCSGARDGMSGALNYSVLIEVAKTRDFIDLDDIMYFANECERLISANKDNKK